MFSIPEDTESTAPSVSPYTAEFFTSLLGFRNNPSLQIAGRKGSEWTFYSEERCPLPTMTGRTKRPLIPKHNGYCFFQCKIVWCGMSFIPARVRCESSPPFLYFQFGEPYRRSALRRSDSTE
jgi:hypothetical protein